MKKSGVQGLGVDRIGEEGQVARKCGEGNVRGRKGNKED